MSSSCSIEAQAGAELRASPEWQALQVKLRERPAGLLGQDALAYIAAEDAAEQEARARIAARYGLRPYQVAAWCGA